MRILERALGVCAAISVVACNHTSQEPRFQFTAKNGSDTVLISDTGTRPIVPFASDSYVTVNFGAGDPYVAIGLNAQTVKAGDRKSFPAALFVNGAEVELRIGNNRYVSSTTGSSGYIEIRKFEFTANPQSIALDSEVSAELTNGQNTITLKGTTHYLK